MTNVDESKERTLSSSNDNNVLVITVDPKMCKENVAEGGDLAATATEQQQHLSPTDKTVDSSSATSSTSSMTANPTTSETTPVVAAESEPATSATSDEASGQEAYVESDDHLPRVQEELDTLNYANEAINNLELELDECKREHATLVEESDEKLKVLEKKLGSCVAKCRAYYELRPEVEDLKAKYLKAKHRFETAQELYVAAKNMQMYAEENLDDFEIKLYEVNEAPPPSDPNPDTPAAANNISQVNTTSNDVSSISYASSSLGGKRKTTQHLNDGDGKEMLTKILEDAKKKVIETESAKQINDQLQIDAYKVYSQKLKAYELMEKDLRRSIEKSREYYDMKAELDKEINFSSAKVEGLKSCLKEAKLTYHQALKNLERISTEIHTQRQTSNLSSALSPSPPSDLAATTATATASSTTNEDESNLEEDKKYDTSNSSSSLIYQNGGADSSLNNRLFSMNDSFSSGVTKATSFENSKLALYGSNSSSNNNKSSNSDLDLTANDSAEDAAGDPEDYDQYFKNHAASVKSPSNSLFTNLDSKSPLETSENSSSLPSKESSPVVVVATSAKTDQQQHAPSRPQFRLPALFGSSHPK